LNIKTVELASVKKMIIPHHWIYIKCMRIQIVKSLALLRVISYFANKI